MARSHLRFPVKDRAGNAIQNALVTLYLKGTGPADMGGSGALTVPSGSIFAAETGGVALAAWELESNDQGEVEAWLETPQSLDAWVSDNSNEAFYPTSPTRKLTFDPFGERVEVGLSPEDLAGADIGAHDASLTAHEPLKADAAPPAVAAAGAVGTSEQLAREDHTHAVTKAVVDALGIDAATLQGSTLATINAAIASAVAAEASARAAADNAHITDATDAHAGSAITNTPAGNIAATTMQGAVNELDTEKAAIASAVMDGDAAGGVLAGTYPSPSFASDMATQAELDAHTGDTTDAHPGTAITNTPAGNVAATTVQDAINELDSEKAGVATAVMDGDAAGGVLSGTYPNPGFAADMATQAELDTHKTSADHDGRYYTETEIDTALAAKQSLSEKGAASGYASLNGSTKVVEDPANATASPTASKIPIAGAGGKLAAGWLQEVLGLTDLTDVILGGVALADKQALLYEASSGLWKNRLLAAGDLPDLSGVYQPLDSDLTAIAGLAPSNDDLVQRKAGAWTNRTPAQLKTDLVLVKGDVGLGNVDNTSDVNKPVSTAQQTALDAKVSKSLFDANTILAANADDTPLALSVAEDRILGRKAGGSIDDLTAAEIKAIIALVAGDLPTHGAAQHTDITRSVWILARPGMVTDGSTTTSVGTPPNILPALQLADAAATGGYAGVTMPKDAKATSPLLCTIYWAVGATDASAHAVVWSIEATPLVNGSDAGAAGTTTAFTGVNDVKTTALLYVETPTQILASVSADDLIRVNVRRLGADGSDTYTGAARLIGIRLDYTATQ